jgi:hypothetical protein
MCVRGAVSAVETQYSSGRADAPVITGVGTAPHLMACVKGKRPNVVEVCSKLPIRRRRRYLWRNPAPHPSRVALCAVIPVNPMLGK